jgi:hypothetical protein
MIQEAHAPFVIIIVPGRAASRGSPPLPTIVLAALDPIRVSVRRRWLWLWLTLSGK